MAFFIYDLIYLNSGEREVCDGRKIGKDRQEGWTNSRGKRKGRDYQ